MYRRYYNKADTCLPTLPFLARGWTPAQPTSQRFPSESQPDPPTRTVDPCSVLQERLDDVPDAEHPQVGVGLAGPDKVDRLAGDIGHRQRGADL